MTIALLRDGNAIGAIAVGAIIGPDLQAGISGWGSTAPEALRDLANAIEREKWPLPELEPPALRPGRVR
jgi:hypothetical protein